MLSVTGKGYSKIYSENPFQEEPTPKAFYHPTKQKRLTEAEKQLALSPKRPDGKRQQQKEPVSAETKFLAGSHTIKPLEAVQKYAPKSPGSSNFDESWPDSERPSSPSLTGMEDRLGRDPLPYASVRKHVQPAFTSSPINEDLMSTYPSHASHGPHSAAVSGWTGPSFLSSRLDASENLGFVQDGQRANKGKSISTAGREGVCKEGGDKGSVLQRYVERFRHGKPMSREERLQLESAQKREFWWLESDPPAPNSTSTPKEGEGRSLPFTSQGRGTLTVENLRKRDDLDSATAELQEKAERLLHSAHSVGSSEPVVSTEGLGSTGSDVTGSSFSEPVVRPAFLSRGGDAYPRFDKQGKMGRPGGQPSEDDILYKWRLQRKLEVARDRPYVPTEAADVGVPKTAAEKEVHSRLAAFKEKLQQRGSVVIDQLQEARVERAVKQVQRVMDAGVQTSPARTPPSSHQDLPIPPLSWSCTRRTDTSVQTGHQDSSYFIKFCKPDVPAQHAVAQGKEGGSGTQKVHGVNDDITSGKIRGHDKLNPDLNTCSSDHQRKAAKQIEECSKGKNNVQYRQFLEAEKPHDLDTSETERLCVHDGGDTPEKASIPRRSDKDRGAPSHRHIPEMVNRESETSASSKLHQPVSQKAVLGEDTSLPGGGGDAAFANTKPSASTHLKHSGRQKTDDKDLDSDNSSTSTHSQRGRRKGQRKNAGKETSDYSGSDRKVKLSSPRENVNQNIRATEAENSTPKHADQFMTKPDSSGRQVHHRSSASSGERTPAARQRSGVERLQGSEVMPPPQHSSSPARPTLSSAIGQVVHDRLFDLTNSVVSSVDSLTSLQRSAPSPVLSRHHPSGGESDYESDGEFESDPLLLVLRQQRQQHEAQLRLLDSIVAKRDAT